MKESLKKILNLFKKEELYILPASLTYYFVLALIPILTLVVLIAGSFNLSIDNVTSLLDDVLPNKISLFVTDIISGKGFDSNIGIFNIIAFIVASNGSYAIVRTANNLYKIKNSDTVKDRIKSIIILFDILMLMIFMIFVPVFGEKILMLFQKNTNLAEEVIVFIKIIKWPITFIVLFINIKLIYTISPSKNIKSKDTTIGSLVTTFLWILSTIILGYYIDYFTNYDILYGNLSGIIALMIWLYVISFVFVLGMVINTMYYKSDV